MATLLIKPNKLPSLPFQLLSLLHLIYFLMHPSIWMAAGPLFSRHWDVLEAMWALKSDRLEVGTKKHH